jgi:hypothetical protein
MTLNAQPILVSDNDALPYVLKLVNGSIHNVSPDFLAGIVKHMAPRQRILHLRAAGGENLMTYAIFP